MGITRAVSLELKEIRLRLRSNNFHSFATSGGSGFGETLAKLKASCPGAILKQGRLIKNSNDIDELIRELHN